MDGLCGTGGAKARVFAGGLTSPMDITARAAAECDTMHIHASCAARDGAAVLLVGPSGSGKSDLALRLLDRGFVLIADDRVMIEGGIASAPPALAGLLEVRGLGIVRVEHLPAAPVRLVVRLGAAVDRLPEATRDPVFGVPVLHIDATHASAAQRVGLALDCAIGARTLLAGVSAA